MGFFDAIGGAVSGAWNAVTGTVGSVVNEVRSANLDWRTIGAIAVGTVAFVGLTVLTGGADLPVAATLLIAGAGSGVAGQLTYDFLSGRKPGVDVLVSGVVSAALTLAGAGLGRLAAPVIGNVLERTGVAAAVSRSPVGRVFAAAGEAEGALASNVGKLVTLVKEGRVGTPKILDPTAYDPPAPPAKVAPPRATRVPHPDPAAPPSYTRGFTRALERVASRSE